MLARSRRYDHYLYAGDVFGFDARAAGSAEIGNFGKCEFSVISSTSARALVMHIPDLYHLSQVTNGTECIVNAL